MNHPLQKGSVLMSDFFRGLKSQTNNEVGVRNLKFGTLNLFSIWDFEFALFIFLLRFIIFSRGS